MHVRLLWEISFIHKLVRLLDVFFGFVPLEADEQEHQRRVGRTMRDSDLPDLLALDVHVGLTECERVDVRLVVQVRKTVIHEPVSDLIAPHGVDDVEHLGVRLQPPVILGNLWCGVVGPSGDATSLEVLDASCANKRLEASIAGKRNMTDYVSTASSSR